MGCGMRALTCHLSTVKQRVVDGDVVLCMTNKHNPPPMCQVIKSGVHPVRVFDGFKCGVPCCVDESPGRRVNERGR
jgi:hypothetical protein